MRRKAFIAPPPPRENHDFQSHMLFQLLISITAHKCVIKAHMLAEYSCLYQGLCSLCL